MKVGNEILVKLSKTKLYNIAHQLHTNSLNGKSYYINTTNISIEQFDINEEQLEIVKGNQTGKTSFNMVLKVNFGTPMVSADVEYTEVSSAGQPKAEGKKIFLKAYGLDDVLYEIHLQFNTRWKIVAVDKMLQKQTSRFMVKSNCSELNPIFCDNLHEAVNENSLVDIWPKVLVNLKTAISNIKIDF